LALLCGCVAAQGAGLLLSYRREEQNSDFLKFCSIVAMNTTGKIQNRGQVTIPTAVRRQAGLATGDLVNFVFRRGKIIITPKRVINRSKFPTADDEYTPEQRRFVDAGIVEGRKGPFYGPFKNGGEIEAFMKKWKVKGKPVKLQKTG
jgi:AbrB family looped-hinge helix DNA binding protein